jgi:hypothetical protein
LTELAKYEPYLEQIIADWRAKGLVTIGDVLSIRNDPIFSDNVEKDTVSDPS